MQPAVIAENVSRIFQNGDDRIAAVDRVSLYANAGELIVLRGRSGSGKTTLINLLSGLDKPTQGRVFINGINFFEQTQARRDRMRQAEIGIVFQSSALFSFLTAVENVELALRLGHANHQQMRKRSEEWLAFVGLGDRMRHRPAELSGGEQQRVAIARAAVHEPALLLADEPTAALDLRTGQAVMDVLTKLTAEKNTCVIMTTHDPAMMERAQRIYTLEDGSVVGDA